MIETLLQADYSLMETLNLPAYHNLSWDTFFFNVSKIGIWFPPVLYMLWVIFRTKKKRGVADSDRHSSRLPSDRQNHVRIDEAVF
ncbi:MAG: hypothetical protein J6X12_09530 [Paludibacteraceae bacterium]|nr:hypothetical protein [Paludibacteraceae bacterium]